VVTITKIDRAARNITDIVGITQTLAAIYATIRILDITIDTTTATGTLILNIFPSVAQFERGQMLLRQSISIEAAKAKDKHKTLSLAECTYNGEKPTARAEPPEAHALPKAGCSQEQVAKALNIGIASVYRIVKDAA